MKRFNASEWRLAIEITWDDPWLKWQTIATVALFAVVTTLFLLRLIPIGVRNGTLVFHYNLYLGIDDIRPWPRVFFPPAVAAFVLAADLSASFLLFRHDRIASRILLSTASAFMILYAIGAAFIMIVNG
jgi:hypothetical protein